ncbi:hypothetical protein CC78DRAFT_615514 [Lojkania enalia]|uniref:Uncharacterized protein n=1 Tax=Lojkania enalia TaxID=147567 RepID=A0A9P4KD28_9PLEO|nr:hypothetical protein CC78DRAFT_615514 [Didymosphaeria enalia]
MASDKDGQGTVEQVTEWIPPIDDSRLNMQVCGRPCGYPHRKVTLYYCCFLACMPCFLGKWGWKEVKSGVQRTEWYKLGVIRREWYREARGAGVKEALNDVQMKVGKRTTGDVERGGVEYEELSALLYGSKTFVFDTPETFLIFTSNLSPTSHSRIARIVVDGRHKYADRTLSYSVDAGFANPLTFLPQPIRKTYGDAYPVPGAWLDKSVFKGKIPRNMPSAWGACCLRLGELNRLRSVRVMLSRKMFPNSSKSRDLDEFVLTPLRCVVGKLNGLEGLEVTVDWPRAVSPAEDEMGEGSVLTFRRVKSKCITSWVESELKPGLGSRPIVFHVLWKQLPGCVRESLGADQSRLRRMSELTRAPTERTSHEAETASNSYLHKGTSHPPSPSTQKESASTLLRRSTGPPPENASERKAGSGHRLIHPSQLITSSITNRKAHQGPGKGIQLQTFLNTSWETQLVCHSVLRRSPYRLPPHTHTLRAAQHPHPHPHPHQEPPNPIRHTMRSHLQQSNQTKSPSLTHHTTHKGTGLDEHPPSSHPVIRHTTTAPAGKLVASAGFAGHRTTAPPHRTAHMRSDQIRSVHKHTHNTYV